MSTQLPNLNLAGQNPVVRRFPFHPYPNSWFVVAFSEELPAKGVMSLRYFGTELVLFRTEDGVARVLDAYCPHLGAHLGCGGVVEGDRLRCPFHGWRFNGESGKCVEVPFASKIPPRAGVRSWPVREQDGAILVWHHADGQPPTWEVPSIHNDDWSDAHYFKWQLRTCCQEILENTVDTAHLPTVHDALEPGGYAPISTAGPLLRHELSIKWDGAYIGFAGTTLDVKLDVSVHGLGVIHVDTFAAMVGMQARQRIFATPIDADHIHLRAALHVRKLGDPETTKSVAEMFRNGFATDFVKDFPIWENKMYRAQPMLSEADGPIGVYRRWCKQFYSEVEDADAAADPRARRSAEHPKLHTLTGERAV